MQSAGWVFAMDAMLKICVQGWKPYWWSSLNRFDFVVTVLIVCLHLVSFFYHDSRNWYVSGFCMGFGSSGS
jgi:two pore calcium channel protein